MDKNCWQDVEGINGETCWLMNQDEFGKMSHCDVWISKEPPVQFINDFLKTCAPAKAAQKFVMLDQGGELCGSPQVSKVVKKHIHIVLLTASDASNQNPVDGHHQTISNAFCAMLFGANLQIQFWPHSLSHAIQIFNSLSSLSQNASPIEMTTNQKEDWTRPKTFGCRVWVRQLGRRPAKF